MTKADQLGSSASFAAVAAPRSTRRRLIDGVTGDTPASPEARTARLADLAHNPLNPRHHLGDLQETADSLLERGQVQPVTVVTRQAFLAAHPDLEGDLGEARYVVIDGNRRLGAARIAGLDELRIDVNDALAATAADILESALVANIQRADLSPLDEAEALATLLNAHGSQRQVARRVGKTHVWVSQRLALLALTPGLQDALRDGELTVEDARQVARLPHDQQAAAAQAAADDRQARRDRSRQSAPPAPQAGTAEADRGNGVSTPPAPPAPGNSGQDDPAPQPARGPAGGNGVSTGFPPSGPDGGSRPATTTPPAATNGAGNAVSTPAPPPGDMMATLDWDDLPAIAGLLRMHLDPGQRQQLATLITTTS
jgi:ParB family transcriptional regulator, chromosome partitioning protein